MSTRLRNCGWILALLFVAAGCKKEESRSATGATPPAASPETAPASDGAPPATNESAGASANAVPPAPATPVKPEDFVGLWKVEKGLDENGKPLTGPYEKMYKSMRAEIRPDQTYVTENEAAGRVHGVWKLEGTNQLKLTPDANRGSFFKATTLSVEKPNLVSRMDQGPSIFYEKVGDAETPTKPKYSMTVHEFLKDVSTDKNAAKTKYDNVPVELSGYVTQIQWNATDILVFIAGPPEEGKTPYDLIFGLRCVPLGDEPWATVCRAQRVKAFGVATIYEGQPMLNEAVFTADGPTNRLEMKATDLAAEFAKDPDAARKKYAQKPIQLDGEVLEVTNEPGNPGVIVGKGDTRVACQLTNDGSDAAKAVHARLKVGQPIRIIGEFNEYAKGAGLNRCFVMSKAAK
jgi:hypothetical protein